MAFSAFSQEARIGVLTGSAELADVSCTVGMVGLIEQGSLWLFSI
jgi:hypothetical protein